MEVTTRSVFKSVMEKENFYVNNDEADRKKVAQPLPTSKDMDSKKTAEIQSRHILQVWICAVVAILCGILSLIFQCASFLGFLIVRKHSFGKYEINSCIDIKCNF